MDYVFAYNEEKDYEFILVKSQGRFEDRINKKDFYYLRLIKKPRDLDFKKHGQKKTLTYVTARIDKDIPEHIQKKIYFEAKKDMFDFCLYDKKFEKEEKMIITQEDFK